MARERLDHPMHRSRARRSGRDSLRSPVRMTTGGQGSSVVRPCNAKLAASAENRNGRHSLSGMQRQPLLESLSISHCW